MINIRNATLKDLPQISTVHKTCFPNNFSTLLGTNKNNRLLCKLYIEYLDEAEELFFVAEDEGKIVGFCMGYYCENNYFQRRYFEHNFLSISLRMTSLLLKGNHLAWDRIKKTIKQKTSLPNSEKCENTKYTSIPDRNNRIDLLSICVIPEYRGQKFRVSSRLIEQFCATGRQVGRQACILSVENENENAIRFYEKHHFEEVVHGENASTYIRELTCENVIQNSGIEEQNEHCSGNINR